MRNPTRMQISRGGRVETLQTMILEVQCDQSVTHVNVLTESIRIHIDMNEAIL